MDEKKKKDNLITFYQAFWYFLFFSILGLMIETAYCYITTGVLESRKGLLYGPFCPVYGIGATILIITLNRYREKPILLFLYGMLVGSIIEYVLSFCLEALYGTRFWEYSYLPFHLNGRICLTYALFWGILSLALIRIIKPMLDRFLNKIPYKVQKVFVSFLFIFLVIDAILTIWGVSIYKQRAMNSYYHKEEEQSTTSFFTTIENQLFSNEKMKKTFPNLRFFDTNGKEIWIRDILL